MRKRLRHLLRQTDLSEKEITLYLQLLALRCATIPQLRETTALPNVTVYRTLKKLENRGLIRVTAVNAKQCRYEPLTLRSLAAAILREQRKMQELLLELGNLDHLLPYALEGADVPPAVEIRSGLDAFKEEYLRVPELLEEEYLHIGNMENFWKVARFSYESAEERTFIRKRMARNIFARVLDIPTDAARQVQKNDSREKRTLVLKDDLPIAKNFLVIGEHRALHFLCDTENPRVIVIRHPELVAAHRQNFNGLWGKP